MRVLHIIDSAGLYGAEMVLLNLVEEQLKQGIEAEIASIGANGTDEKPIESTARLRKLPIQTFRMLPGPNPVGMMRVLHYARRTDVDILHSHGYKGNVAFGLIPRSIRKIPMVSTVHGYTSHSGFSKNRIYELMDWVSLRFVDHVVLVNRGMLGHPRLRKLRCRRLSVIDNGIALNAMDKAVEEKPPLDEEIVNFCKDGIVLGSIGRLSYEKGYDILLRACSRLRRDGVNAKVVIIGEGQARRELKALISFLDLNEAAFLPGYRENAARYMSLFDIYVISSHTEGLPMSLLEAMAAGIPVVATAVGGIPSVLNNGRLGTLVQPDDCEDLVQGISNAYKNKAESDAMVGRARARVQEQYTSQAMAIKYSAAYSGLVSDSSLMNHLQSKWL